MLLILHLNLDAGTKDRPLTRTIVALVFGVSILACVHFTHGYLGGGQYDWGFITGQLLGGITAVWIWLKIRFGLLNPFQPAACKGALIRALTTEGKTPRDFWLTILPAAGVWLVLASAVLFILHGIREFNR
jgi:hypothetical protein